MQLRIYQINTERDKDFLFNVSHDRMTNILRSFEMKSDIYDLVYEGQIPARDLEDAFTTFQHSSSECPQEYSGRSMSVSDVVEVTSSKTVENGFYYCDTVGFKEVLFDPEKVTRPPTIDVLMIEPGKMPRKATIENNLPGLQQAVDGCFEIYYPFSDDPYACIVCNDSGKINNMLPNRAIYDSKGEMQDVIFGPFFICDGSEENLKSLTDDRLTEYGKQFKYPEELVYRKGRIAMEKFNPEKNLTIEEIY